MKKEKLNQGWAERKKREKGRINCNCRLSAAVTAWRREKNQ